MPGKVNPVIPEVVNQVAFEVVGNDLTITMAAEAGQLQLNAFEPIIARALLSSLDHLTAAVNVLGERCMRGITANAERMRNAVLGSASIATALNPLLGYEAATALVAEAIATGASIPGPGTALGPHRRRRADAHPQSRKPLPAQRSGSRKRRSVSRCGVIVAGLPPLALKE